MDRTRALAIDEEHVSAPASPPTQPTFLHGECPIEHLPPELLAFIYTLAHPKHQSPQKVPFEVTLSHVSRRWREVAHGTSALWNRVIIYSPQSLVWVSSYLKRTGPQTPLDITIDAYRWDFLKFKGQRARIAFANAIARDVLPYIDRVRSLTILCYQEFTGVTILSSLANASAHNLQRFKVKLDGVVVGMPRRTHGIELFTEGSPNIKYIDTDLADCLPSHQYLGNLTTLFLHPIYEASNVTYPELVSIFTAVPSLLHLSIVGSTQHLISSWPMHHTEPNFELPNLQSLRLVDNGMLAVKLLLSISAPQLESLWLHCSLSNFNHLYDAPQMTPGFSAAPKFAKLKYLTVPHSDLEESVAFAKIFPNIVYLHLPYANLYHGEQLQAALIGRWHALRSIVLTLVRETKWQKLPKILAAALPNRRQANCPIEALLVDRDFRRMLQKAAPYLSQHVRIEDISADNYQESWWNKAEERDLD